MSSSDYSGGETPPTRRSRSRDSRKRRHGSHKRRDRRSKRRDPLDQILQRLNALEERLPVTATNLTAPSRPCVRGSPSSVVLDVTEAAAGVGVATPSTSRPAETPRDTSSTADGIVGALSSLLQVRSKHYYISNFDPSVHDFDVWCAEVDRGRNLNGWDDHECFGRIGGCLRGDAKTWLNHWVTSDRSWSNFKAEFRSLCPREVDMATVLYDVMSTTSNKFTTYAEYARMSLLRLNIVRGLSDELKTAIVVRGISDPQVKAAATNAKLQLKDLVEFLSVYVKPKITQSATGNPIRSSVTETFNSRKREAPRRGPVTCFSCGKHGHKQADCSKKSKVDSATSNSKSTSSETSNVKETKSNSKPAQMICKYCKKTGHLVDWCFLKQRMDSKSNDKSSSDVNFCSASIPDETT
ncbi:hypothetical protein PYW08_002660 [Mythimna loreyi]|uniref:Uncharacterized protein n=1 Tax=Mythimna loreyi TaxID=667449 RepID=A0ACC2QIJ4_9NEOP|nr:hypothetical protein PYW08_002660 [Mythimna loreyi]